MCNLNKKIVLFDYAVDQFVNWDKEVTNREGVETNEILKSFNFTRYMKLLYFTCLESFDTSCTKNMGLFDVFKNFWAYKNGPVELDVYRNRSCLFKFSFNGDFLELRNTQDTQENNLSKEQYLDEKKVITKAISSLKERKNFYMDDTYFMIDLSHNLKIWKDSIILSPPILTLSIETLKEEKKLFEEQT